jgi:hypothetical protein
MDQIIFEDKPYILNQLKECVENQNLNLILTGVIPNGFIKECIKPLNIPESNVIYVDCFNDINLLSDNNSIVIHSKKTSAHIKVIVLLNFDNVSEYIQANFKMYMNPKTFFIFCSDGINKIYESIVTRTTHISFKPNSHDNLILYLRSNASGLDTSNLDLDLIKHTTFDTIDNIINYVKLLGETSITDEHIHELHLFKNNNINEYIKLVKLKNIDAIHVLYKYYELGYSLLDIYFFIYEYVKIHMITDFGFEIINIVSHYINEIYEGHDYKLMIVFLTSDIINHETNI